MADDEKRLRRRADEVVRELWAVMETLNRRGALSDDDASLWAAVTKHPAVLSALMGDRR